MELRLNEKVLREKGLEYEAEPVTAEEDAADMVVAAVAAEGEQIDAPDDPMAVAAEGEQNDAPDDSTDKNQTIPPPTIIQTETPSSPKPVFLISTPSTLPGPSRPSA